MFRFFESTSEISPFATRLQKIESMIPTTLNTLHVTSMSLKKHIKKYTVLWIKLNKKKNIRYRTWKEQKKEPQTGNNCWIIKIIVKKLKKEVAISSWQRLFIWILPDTPGAPYLRLLVGDILGLRCSQPVPYQPSSRKTIHMVLNYDLKLCPAHMPRHKLTAKRVEHLIPHLGFNFELLCLFLQDTFLESPVILSRKALTISMNVWK